MITREQLIGFGFSGHAIDHRIERGRLHPVARGVYAVGRPDLTRRGWWMATVLGCGSRAVLSHRSAAALWGIGVEPRGRIEVSVLASAPRRRPGVRVRRRPTLPESNLTVHGGIPVTAVVQTLVDLATCTGESRLERAVNDADRLDLIDPVSLREEIDSHRGQPGVVRLRTLLDRRTFRLTRSRLERLFLPLAEQAGLPVPLTKQWVNGFEVDFYWPNLGLVVETDGLQYHRTPAEQARDRLRDQAHTAAGLTALRFTHEQVRYEQAHVRAALAAVARRLEREKAKGA